MCIRDRLTTSSILWSAGSETVGVVIFNFTSAGKTNMASAYSTVILLLAAIGFGLLKLSGWLAEWVRVRPAVRAACFTNERIMPVSYTHLLYEDVTYSDTGRV